MQIAGVLLVEGVLDLVLDDRSEVRAYLLDDPRDHGCAEFAFLLNGLDDLSGRGSTWVTCSWSRILKCEDSTRDSMSSGWSERSGMAVFIVSLDYWTRIDQPYVVTDCNQKMDTRNIHTSLEQVGWPSSAIEWLQYRIRTEVQIISKLTPMPMVPPEVLNKPRRSLLVLRSLYSTPFAHPLQLLPIPETLDQFFIRDFVGQTLQFQQFLCTHSPRTRAISLQQTLDLSQQVAQIRPDVDVLVLEESSCLIHHQLIVEDLQGSALYHLIRLYRGTHLSGVFINEVGGVLN